jgi:hypothetical protein
MSAYCYALAVGAVLEKSGRRRFNVNIPGRSAGGGQVAGRGFKIRDVLDERRCQATGGGQKQISLS